MSLVDPETFSMRLLLVLWLLFVAVSAADAVGKLPRPDPFTVGDLLNVYIAIGVSVALGWFSAGRES